MLQLPLNRQLKKLWDICNFINGRAFKPSEWSNEWLPIIRIQNLNNEISHYNFCNFEVPERIHIKNWDLLVSRSGTPGTSFGAFIWKWSNAVLNQHIFKTEIDDNLVNKYYLKSAINNILDEMISKAHGWAWLKHINKWELENIQIPLPPLPTQHTIVARLDEASATIQAAKSAIQDQIDALDILWQSSLSKVFDNSDYEKKPLSQLTSILWDGLHGTPKYDNQGEYCFINGNNLDNWNILLKDGTKKVSIEEYEKYKKNLNNRTIFVSINGTIWNVAFYNNEKIILGKSACYFNILDGVDKGFIKYAIMSPYFLEYANKELTGTTIKNVSLKTMRNFQIPLPSLPEQQQIVSDLDKLSQTINNLKTVYKSQLAEYDALWASTLDKAFRGELVS